MKDSTQIDNVERLVNYLRDEQIRLNEVASNRCSLLTINVRTLNILMSKLGIKWSDISELVEKHVPIHPQIKSRLLSLAGDRLDDCVETVLRQDFVRSDTIHKLKFLKNATPEMNYLCGVDGLVRHAGPVLDWRRYIQNLRFAIDGPKGVFDDEPSNELKRVHVQTVRKLYSKLNNCVNNVYKVMRAIVQENSSIYLLPNTVDTDIDDDMLEDMKEFYFQHVSKNHFTELLKVLNVRDESEKKKKKKTSGKTEECEGVVTIVDNNLESDDVETSESKKPSYKKKKSKSDSDNTTNECETIAKPKAVSRKRKSELVSKLPTLLDQGEPKVVKLNKKIKADLITNEEKMNSSDTE